MNSGQQKKEKRLLSLIEKGAISIHKGAAKLGIPYTTIHSRICRGAKIMEAFTKPIVKREKTVGNTAWRALGNKSR